MLLRGGAFFIAHYSKNERTQHFGNLIFPSSASFAVTKWFVERLRIAFSEEPTRVGVFPSPEDGN
jgi:hypothetical protein